MNFFTFERNQDSIEAEALLDWIYVIRTSVSGEELGPERAVRSYKDLADVEQGFRVMKGSALEAHPARHQREERVRAHVFLCMLARYDGWHMEEALVPLLSSDHEAAEAEARCTWLFR